MPRLSFDEEELEWHDHEHISERYEVDCLLLLGRLRLDEKGDRYPFQPPPFSCRNPCVLHN